MKDDAWIVQQFLNERGARELSGHGATLGAFERIRDRLSAAERGQKEALAQMCKTARELGEVQGKLMASELPGIIDGWRERAEAAERERDEARGVLSGLALYLSAGSGDDTTTADRFDDRIRWGIDHAISAAVNLEREQCAKLCAPKDGEAWTRGACWTGDLIAARIRARATLQEIGENNG